MQFPLFFILTSLKQTNKYTIKFRNFFLYLILIQLLYKEGFIKYYFLQKKIQSISIFTKKELFQNYKTISTVAANTFFLNYKNIFTHQEKGMTFFISTNKGIMTLLNCKKKHIGGLILFKI